MNTVIEHKTLTVRLPPELYQSSQEVAKERHVSMNVLVQESLAALIRAEQERKLFDDFTLLGEDAEACDMEYAIYAASEVVLGDDAAVSTVVEDARS